MAKKLCAKSIKYGTLRLLLRSAGSLSAGVRTGWKYGFDSGESLDYVYENTPRGIGPLGKIIDKHYLNSAGWRGIRLRGINLKKAINWAIEKQSDSEDKLVILDIASGPGRYMLDVLSQLDDKAKVKKAYLCDLDEAALNLGRHRARNLGLNNVLYSKRDAFTGVAQTQIAQVDIAIASGLYELFSDNDMIKQSLNLLNESVKEGGYLIYTNQPWHPQLEFIGKVLTNRHGEPWEMRCRSQSEMDELVNAAGFSKLAMHSDEQGIFTVSIATKRSISASNSNSCNRSEISVLTEQKTTNCA